MLAILSKSIVVGSHSDWLGRRNALLTSVTIGGLGLLLFRLFKNESAAVPGAKKRKNAIQVCKDPREWNSQTVSVLVEAVGGLKSKASDEHVKLQDVADLVTDVLAETEPKLVSETTDASLGMTLGTPPTPIEVGEVTQISKTHAECLVKGYADQYEHTEWNGQVPIGVAKNVLKKAFTDGLTLATQPNPVKRRAVLEKALSWETKKCDAIPSRAVETGQVKKMQAEAKHRRIKISTSREKGKQVLSVSLERASSTWSMSSMSSVSSTWSALSGQSVLDRVRGLSSRCGNSARELLGIRV